MKVIKNGEKVEMTYAEVCKDLGIIAEVKFVKITTRGIITFTLGTPSDIWALVRAVDAKGYKPARSLTDTLYRL